MPPNMKKDMTVEQVKKEGYDVYIRHERLYEDVPNMPPLYLSPTGGATYAELTDKVTGHVATAEARCNNRDNYNRKIGVKIALGRAYKMMKEGKVRKVDFEVLT